MNIRMRIDNLKLDLLLPNPLALALFPEIFYSCLLLPHLLTCFSAFLREKKKVILAS